MTIQAPMGYPHWVVNPRTREITEVTDAEHAAMVHAGAAGAGVRLLSFPSLMHAEHYAQAPRPGYRAPGRGRHIGPTRRRGGRL